MSAIGYYLRKPKRGALPFTPTAQLYLREWSEDPEDPENLKGIGPTLASAEEVDEYVERLIRDVKIAASGAKTALKEANLDQSSDLDQR